MPGSNVALPPAWLVWARVFGLAGVVILVVVLIHAGCDPYLAIAATLAAIGAATRLTHGR